MHNESASEEPDELVLEGIALTGEVDGSPHVAPMGPIVDRDLTRFRLRPFATSQTYQNLRRSGWCVFHVIDDVDLLARAAVGQLRSTPEVLPTPSRRGWILSDCCRWFELSVEDIEESGPRIEIRCRVHDQGHLRDFFGWNRAKHAVLEAAILATRIGILSADDIRDEFSRLQVAIEKTAGKQERQAMRFLREYIQGKLPSDPT